MKSISANQISAVMSNLGKRGKGKSKVRGDAAYYKNLTAIREAKRKTSKEGLEPPPQE